jgi:alkanesulfonate monooxygenase SsuD/methylene tetrahydromethanopterin reductase-like flavin-dependent oxidoreductase (luciferase family)
MQFGLGLPSAGEAASGPNLVRFAQHADALGFESLWCGDHILLPTAGTRQYPYTLLSHKFRLSGAQIL